jgi:hypothetical protein
MAKQVKKERDNADGYQQVWSVQDDLLLEIMLIKTRKTFSFCFFLEYWNSGEMEDEKTIFTILPLFIIQPLILLNFKF